MGELSPTYDKADKTFKLCCCLIVVQCLEIKYCYVMLLPVFLTIHTVACYYKKTLC